MVEAKFFIGDIGFHTFLLFIFTVVLTIILGALSNSLITKLMRKRFSPRLYKPVSKIAMYTVYAGGLFIALNNIIHFNIPASLAALGVLGIAMLLPAVPILQGLAAGLVLTLERPFKEEDIIRIDGELCKVKDIGLRKTKLRSLNGNIIIVPNLLFITGTTVVNYSAGEFIKVTEEMDISAKAPIDLARTIIGKVCTVNPNILPNIPEKKITRLMKLFEMPKTFLTHPKNVTVYRPQVLVKKMGQEKISLIVWFWIWDITAKERIVSSFYEELQKQFKEQGIEFG